MAADEPRKRTQTTEPHAGAAVRAIDWGPPSAKADASKAVSWSPPKSTSNVVPWAFERRTPALTTPSTPSRPSPAKPQPPAPSTQSVESVGQALPESPEPQDISPEPAGSEPVIPDGMILVSEEALAEREDAIVEALRTPYLEAARKLLLIADEVETRLRDDVVELSARIAQALVYRELKTDRAVILEVAQRALRLVGPLERLTVRCAPEDAELLRENLPGLARAEVGRVVEVLVRPSDDIMPGGLLLTFEGGVVDAREERRLARITEAVKTALHDVESETNPQQEPPA